MNYKKILTLTIFLLCLLTITAVSAGDNATDDIVGLEEVDDEIISVEEMPLSDNNEVGVDNKTTSLLQQGSGDNRLCDGIKSLTELENLFNDHPYEDIELDSDYVYDGGKDSAHAITINRDPNFKYVIKGNGHIIDGNGGIGLFYIEKGSIEFRDIIFKNAIITPDVEESGGAIKGNCVAINCTFENNYAKNYGGAMYGGTAINCTFINNHVDDGGGGGAIAAGNAINCTFDTNTAVKSSGGAIHEGNATDCTFMRNHAGDHGGAMYCGTAVNCYFIQNNAGGNGGAIDNGNAINCIFEDENNAVSNGGAMHLGTAENCQFINNYALDGGAVSHTVVKNCNFYNCRAYKMGGGMIAASAENCTFTNCSAQIGGAICDCNFALNCVFIGNNAKEMRGKHPDYNGGGMHQGFAINCTFINNTAENDGSAIYNGSVVLCTFINNEISGTNVVPAILNAVESTVKVGEKFLFNITYANNDFYFKEASLIGVNTSITVYNKSNEVVGTYYCLSDSWNVDLIPGDYNVELSVVNHSEVENVRVSLKVISTTTIVSAKNIPILYGHDNYVVKLVDSKNRALSGFVVSVVLNGTENYTTDENGEFNVKTKDLTPGIYSVNITFMGNEYYLESTFNTTIFIVRDGCKLVINPVEIVYGSNQELTITLYDGENNTISDASVSVDLEGVNNYTTDNNGQINVSTSDLIPGTYQVNITFNGNNLYYKAYNNTEIVVTKGCSEFEVKDVVTDYNVTKDVVIILKDNYDNLLSNFSVSVELNGVENYTTDKDGQIKLSTDALLPDTYQVNISFAGNNLYNKSNATFKITINKISSIFKVNNVITFYNVSDDLIIGLNDANANPICNVNVSVDFNGNENYSTDENGEIRLSCEGLLPNSYPVSVSFEGNEIYLPSNTTSSVYIMRVFSVFYLNELVTDYNDTKIFVISLKDVFGNPLRFVPVYVEWADSGNYATDENGEIHLSSEDLLLGTYPVSVSFEGNEKYLPASATSKIVINKLNTILTANNLTVDYDEDGEVVISLKDINGNPLKLVPVYIEWVDSGNYATDDNGEIHLSSEDLLPGTYQVNITFEGNEIYLPTNTTSKIVINKLNSVLNANNLTLDYDEYGVMVISLKDVNDNPLKLVPVYIEWADSGNYATDENGEIHLSSEDLLPGIYQVNITFEGNEKYLPTNTTSKIVINKLNSVLNANNLTAVYSDDGILVISLKDDDGNPLCNVSLSVDLNGVSNYTTDDIGEVRLSSKNLIPATYPVNITFNGNEIYLPSNTTSNIVINKLSTTLTANKIEIVYGDSTNLVITLNDGKGNPLSNASVSVDLNGNKKYNTDTKGQITIPIKNFAPKNYAATITYSGDNCYNGSSLKSSFVVKKATPKLTAKSKTYKRTQKVKKYVVILKTNQNKAMKNAKIIINVNHKTCAAKTNSKGYATFKITKLTKKGKYIVYIKYAGNKYYTAKTMKTKIIVK